jgi:hypothetical protein
VASLRVHKHFQRVRKLPFCYLCGRSFEVGDEIDGDHVPPRAAFNPRDRDPTLKLRTHKACNASFSVQDRKVAQLIAMRRGESPKSPRDQALQFVQYPHGMVALENLNVEGAIWRWVRGFHAAIYERPLPGDHEPLSIQTPFPRGEKKPDGSVAVRSILPQHLLAVDVIKRNRAAGKLDGIIAHRETLRYECVWVKADSGDAHACFFALDIYDWKDLGSHTAEIPARGCVGIYMLPDKTFPLGATLDRESPIAIPNRDVYDPFAR